MRRERASRPTKMRSGALAFVVFVAAFAGAACADAPPAPAPRHRQPAAPRIVVAFANPAHSAPAPAGTHRQPLRRRRLQRLAERRSSRRAGWRSAYALRAVASWPIEALAMHCVVFEITNGRADGGRARVHSPRTARVLLAQPLQEFHTLTERPRPRVAYNDPLYDLQTNLSRARHRARAQAHPGRGAEGGADRHRGGRAATRICAGASCARIPICPRHAAAGSLRHGTAMAGLIAAVANNHIGIVGIAPLAQVEVFEACWQLQPDDDAAACNTFTLAQALAAALASGAPLVNLSIAGPARPAALSARRSRA